MKAKERHQLKENEFAKTAAKVAGVVQEQRSRVLGGVIAVLAIAVVVGGVLYWRKHQADAAGAMLGVASSTAQAQIAPPSTIPGQAQAPGTYPTAQARDEAALKAFQDVVAQYPSADASLVAEYQAGAELLSLGRNPEAETTFRHVAERASTSSLYSSMARLGLSQALMAEGKTDDAIKTLTDLSAERDGLLPVDGVLMQLASAYQKSGKTQDAKAAYKRVVDEFPQSSYQSDAKEQLAALN